MSSRTLNDLSVGTSVWVPEIIDSVDTLVEYYFLKKSSSNGILLRKDCLMAKRMHSSNVANYPDAINENGGDGSVCEMDKYLCGTFLTSRFSSAMQNCLSAETIKYYDLNCKYGSEAATIEIARRIFLLSYSELGYATTPDEGDSMLEALKTCVGTTAANTARIGYGGGAAVYWWMRSAYSSASFRRVHTNGNAVDSNATITYNWLRPALSVALATSVSPSGETTIAILPDSSKQYRDVGGTANLGNATNRPKKAILNIATDNLYDKTFRICNNMNDNTPTWENYTEGSEHTFTNTTKTDTNWAIGIEFYGKSLSVGKFGQPTVLVMEDDS